MLQIAVIDESDGASDSDIQTMLPAFKTQWNRDLDPIWGVGTAEFAFVPKHTAPQAGAWWVVFLNDSDQANALAYHDLTNEGLPISKVFVHTLGSLPLTRRDGKAPHLLSALSLAAPTNDGPSSIDPSLIEPLPAEVKDRADASPNGMQRNLSAAAAMLPGAPPTKPADIPPPTSMPAVQFLTVAIAHANATASTNRFLGL